jgi:AcrR family transcriptional regulator
VNQLAIIARHKRTHQKNTSRKKAGAKQRIEPESPPNTGARARGKSRRRLSLVRAARDLIAERDDSSFSMQELADRAGLSLATSYNLIGSKAVILQPLVEGLIEEGSITVAISPAVITNHLQRIFESTFLHWAALDWDEGLFRSELRSGFALTFLGLFKRQHREALLAEL